MMESAASTMQSHSPKREFGRKVKVYSSQAAATIEATVTREGEPTLSVELAKKITGTGRYDWETKIAVQLTPSELIQFNRALLGYLDAFACEYHGEQRSKALRLFALTSADGWMLAASQPGSAIQVPLKGADCFNVAALAVSQLADQWPKLGVGGVLAILRKIPQ